jgi:hypothetical protein
MLTATAVLALTAILPTAGTASAGAERDRTADVEVLRLECQARTTDAGSVVRCEWSEPTSPAAAAVKLFRLDPAVDDHRRVVYRSGNLAQTEFTDTSVRTGHRYAYAVVAVNADGRLVARSRTEWVRVPAASDVEVLRLHCELGDAADVVGCEWSRPTEPRAHVVTLWRSVDGGAREVVERFRPAGPNAYRDRVPPAAEHIVYAIVVTDRAGGIVGRSRPDVVRIPEVDVRPSDRSRELAAP